MPESGQTKTCPLCAETIQAAAHVCPHCRHSQRTWSFQNPQISAAIVILMVLGVAAAFGAFLDKIFGSKRDFSEYRNDIAVVSSQVSHTTRSSNLLVSVVGVVTNRGLFSWTKVGLEAQLFDGQGRLIDVVQTSDYNGFPILPHSEAAFKVEVKAVREKSDYTSHKVIVRWAKDPRSWD